MKDNPILLEEMAWSFAQLVSRKGILIDDVADREFSRLVPSARDRRACVAVALLREWVTLAPPSPHPGWDHDYYQHGPKFFHERRRRHEALHGIGSYPREEWEQ